MKNFSSFLALIIEFACFRSGWLSKWPFFEVAHSKLSLLSEWLFFKRRTVCFAFFPRAQKMVNISNHLGEQFFGGAPDQVVAARRARARVRGSGLKPYFQRVPSQTFSIKSKHSLSRIRQRKWEKFYLRKICWIWN